MSDGVRRAACLEDGPATCNEHLVLGVGTRIPDLVRREAENNEINTAYAAATTRSPLPSGRDAYRTLADYNADMSTLATRYPSLVRRFALNHRSLDGRPVYGLEIARDVRGRKDGRPTFAIMALHHAREWPSGENTMEFAFDLVRNYGSNTRITRLLNRARVVVVPVVNVDGFHLSRTDGALIDLRDLDGGDTGSILATPGNAYKRKNCRVVDARTRPTGRAPRSAPRAPGGSGSVSTRTATTAGSGAGRGRRRRSPIPRTGASDRSPSRRRRTSASWSPAVR